MSWGTCLLTTWRLAVPADSLYTQVSHCKSGKPLPKAGPGTEMGSRPVKQSHRNQGTIWQKHVLMVCVVRVEGRERLGTKGIKTGKQYCVRKTAEMVTGKHGGMGCSQLAEGRCQDGEAGWRAGR